MNNKKILILRTCSFDKFNVFIDFLSEHIDLDNSTIVIQDNLDSKEQVQNSNKFKFIYIEPKKISFLDGWKIFSIFKYEKVIIPLNSFSLKENLNLLFFSLFAISKKYFIYNPSFTYKKYNYFQILFLTVFLEIFSWLVLFLGYLPFVILKKLKEYSLKFRSFYL
jgi:hypothetical protein